MTLELYKRDTCPYCQRGRRYLAEAGRTDVIMRDIIAEQTGWNLRLAWLFASLPCLLIAIFRLQSFVGLARIAGVIQVLTGLGIILAYNLSRRRIGSSAICGRWGTLPFQILVIVGSLAATAGSVISVK